MIVTQFTAYLHTAIQSIYRLHTLHAAISVNVLSTTAGNIDVPTHHMSADTVESASNPAYPTSNPNEVAGDPAYPPAAYPEQLGYPPTYPHQTAGAYPSAYPQQPMANSTYPVQPVGAQPFTAVTVVNQPKHVSVQHIAAIILY